MCQPGWSWSLGPRFQGDRQHWGVGVQICYHGTEKSKRTAWRRWQFKLSLRRQAELSKAKEGISQQCLVRH